MFQIVPAAYCDRVMRSSINDIAPMAVGAQ